MDLQFINPGFEYMIEKIMGFQHGDTTAFWSDPLYRFYPQLDKEYSLSLPLEERMTYIAKTLRDVYDNDRNTIENKIHLYSAYWEKCRPQITSALSDAFELDLTGSFNDMRCNISMNPIEPRYLRKRTFDVFYLNSERGAVGEAIHEIIHFVWFYVWNKTFGDGYDEYESPSMKWILSEMVVESVMRDGRLSSINPYFEREQGGCIYPYFFDMKAGGEFILDTLDGMYRKYGIVDFMKQSYSYCLAHEGEIREHIARAEK